MIHRTVLISGAGIAGPTLAFWLHAAGFEPTLIETAPALRRGGYVIDFWGLGYDIAERMGLLPEIQRVGYHMREMRIVDHRGRRVAGFGTGVLSALTGGRFTTLARSELSRLLFAQIRGASEVIFDNEIVGLDERADGVTARFKRGGDRRFDLVVGADGLHSRVRKLVFGPQDQFEKQLGYAVAAFEAKGYKRRDEDVYVLYGRPGQMLGRGTLRDDRALFLFVFTNDRGVLPPTRELQQQMLRDRYADAGWECQAVLDELPRADELYFDRVSQIRMPRWSRGRVALVGDAAFCVSLLAGQGSALAMISAYVLAGELARARDGYQEALDRYETLLRDFIASKQRAAERFASAFAPRTKLGLAFRNLMIRASAIPGLARMAVGRDITDKLQLPDYGWAQPEQRRAGSRHVS
jgi:2-polyprenyl-6-methoxyphenol hydroxylase-like FAD-dependent oxidoreductase